MILSGRDVAWYIEKKKLVIDPINSEQFQQNGVDLILDEVTSHPSNFTPGQFVLGTTREYIEMPDDLMAFVQLRSTWARSGIILPPTVVDAGFKGTITLEIVPFSGILVPYRQRFAHLIFAKMANPSDPYNGKYQGQKGITQARKD